MIIVLVIKPGADPVVVGRRIAGPNASVSRAYPNRRPQENLLQAILLRTFVVAVPLQQEQATLKRAQADPNVDFAYIDVPAGAH